MYSNANKWETKAIEKGVCCDSQGEGSWQGTWGHSGSSGSARKWGTWSRKVQLETGWCESLCGPGVQGYLEPAMGLKG